MWRTPLFGTLTALAPFQGKLAPTLFLGMTRQHQLLPLELGTELEEVAGGEEA